MSRLIHIIASHRLKKSRVSQISPRRDPDIKRALLTGLAVLPACLLGALVIKYGVDVPYWDQWHISTFFIKLSEGTLTAADLFDQANEYREFFPHLLIVALGRATRWDVRYEMLCIFCLACLVAYNVYRLGAPAAGGDPSRRFWLALISGLLIFSPIQHENWLFGIQIVYFVPIVCVTTCLRVADSRLGENAKLLLCMCLATLSTFSAANGILCWVVVLPALAWQQPLRRLAAAKWRLLVWTAGFASNAALYFYDYRKPVGHPDLGTALVHPLSALGYFFSFLGSPLGLGQLYPSAALGVVLLALFLLAWLFLPRLGADRARSRAVLTWLMVGAYSVMTAVLVTLGRSGYGARQSLFSRYTTFSIYLIVALVHLAPLVLGAPAVKDRLTGGFSSGRRLLPALAAVLLLWNLPVYYLGVRQMSMTRADRMQGKACLMFINLVRDECLTEKMLPDLGFLERRANALDRLGYIRPGLIRSRRVRQIDGGTAAGGSFEQLARQGDGYVASGRAMLPGGARPADAVLIACEDQDGDPLILALAHAGAEEPSAARPRHASAHDESHWREFIPAELLPAGAESLSAWAFDAATGRASKLDGVRRIRDAE